MGYSGISAENADHFDDITIKAMKDVGKMDLQEMKAEQLLAKEAFQESLLERGNPFAALRKSQKPKETQFRRVKKSGKLETKVQNIEANEQMERRANDLEKRNPEMKAKTLLLLRENIKPEDTAEEILRKLMEFYPDVTLADEAIEYLLQTTEGDLNEQVKIAKKALTKDFAREIAAGRNIADVARQAKALGTPTTLRDLYRDITGNPREPNDLFDELSQRYNYNDLQKVIKFLFHALGSDMKSKGPSIPRGQLHNLIKETRALQAIQGVYRFFRLRMKLMEKLFSKNGLVLPQRLSFEALAKNFMSLVTERYPTSDKVLLLAEKLGIDKWIIAKIIVISQMRDAIREVAMNQIFKTVQHRDELYAAIIESLEDLEDEWEDEEDEEEDDEEES